MTKTELIEILKKEMGLPRPQIESIASTLIEEIKAALLAGQPVKISGFGRFEVKTRAARRGRDPATGKIRTLPPRKNVSFTPSRLLKKGVNGE
jgi:integration host factor subunit alpha